MSELFHYGTKGMKWRFRKNRSPAQRTEVVSGPPSDDVLEQKMLRGKRIFEQLLEISSSEETPTDGQ